MHINEEVEYSIIPTLFAYFLACYLKSFYILLFVCSFVSILFIISVTARPNLKSKKSFKCTSNHNLT